jgi:hypothetical protein
MSHGLDLISSRFVFTTFSSYDTIARRSELHIGAKNWDLLVIACI